MDQLVVIRWIVRELDNWSIDDHPGDTIERHIL